MKVQDTYKEPFILDIHGARVRVFKPELSEEERRRRMTAIHNSAAELLKHKKGVCNG
jgi:hypothetical protein